MAQKITETTTDRLMGSAAGIGIQPYRQHPDPTISLAAPHKIDPAHPEKVAILGTAPSSKMLAPFKDPSWTIWGSSPGNSGDPESNPQALPRCDLWVEVHANFMWPEYRQVYGEAYVKWLNEIKIPVLAPIDLEIYKELFPRAAMFPWRRLVDKFGPYFFTSTFAWMMAQAIDVGVKEIALYGVDMSSKDEYILQRPGGHYFILEAKKAGIKVTVPPESDLIQPPPLYGLADSTPQGRKLATRRVEVTGRLNNINAQLQQLQGQAAYLSGALEDIHYFSNVFAANPD